MSIERLAVTPRGARSLLLLLVFALASIAVASLTGVSTADADGGQFGILQVYTKQNPRWEAPGRGPHRPTTKPYKPQHLPPEDLPVRGHATGGSRALNRFDVAALVGILVIAYTAEWLASSVRLSPAWIALLAGLIIGPVTGLFDPATAFGKVWLPLVALVLVVLLFEHLLRMGEAGFDDGRLLAGMVGAEAAVIGAGAGGIAVLVGLDLAAAALLIGLLLMAQGTTRRSAATDAAALVERAGIFLETIGIVLVLVVCETLLAGRLHRDAAPAAVAFASVVLGGSLGGLGLGYGLVPLLRDGQRDGHPLLLLLVVLGGFALFNLFLEGSGFFVVLALGTFLALRTPTDRSSAAAAFAVPPAVSVGLLTMLAAAAKPDVLTPLTTGGLGALVVLLLVARLVSWRARVPWPAQLALTGDPSTTALAVATASVCAARLVEFGILPGPLVFTLVVLAVFIRLAVASLVSVFEGRGWSAATAPAKVPERA